MHRVVQMNSVGKDSDAIKIHKEVIKNKLSDYSCHDSEVNDGNNNVGITLGVNADFNNATQANEFHTWLKNYIQYNRNDFSSCRTRIHDCYHAANINLPCEIGDIWSL